MDIRDLVAEDDLFDPLEDEQDQATPEAGVGDDGQPEAPLVGEPLEEFPDEGDDTRPPRQRIYELLGQMPGQRRLLLALVDHCRDQKTGEEMDRFTEQLQVHNFSVYSPVVLRELLENAGAICYVAPEDEKEALPDGFGSHGLALEDSAPEDGLAQAPGAAGHVFVAAAGGMQDSVLHEHLQSGTEDVDIEYLEIPEQQPGWWLATPEGVEIVDEQDDFGAIKRLLGKEPQYLGIYQRILDHCAEVGRSAKELDDLVNDDPLLEDPRRYSGYFVGRLEREGAIAWANGWVLTDAGSRVLQTLADEVEDAQGAEVAEASGVGQPAAVQV